MTPLEFIEVENIELKNKLEKHLLRSKVVSIMMDFAKHYRTEQLTLTSVSQRSKLLKAEDKDVPFDDYIQKYFEEPKVELTYKSKRNKNVMTETELIKYYKRAMCL